MTLRLYLDENIPPLLAQHLRRRGFDVVSAHEVEMTGTSDEEQLEYAVQNARAILSFDTDFVPLALRWLSESKHHYGVIVSQELKAQQIGELIKLCSRFLSQISPKDAADMIFSLQQFKADFKE